MTGHVHYWKLESYEIGVIKCICSCGSVKFKPSFHDSEMYTQRAKELNETLGHVIETTPAESETIADKKEDLEMADDTKAEVKTNGWEQF